MTLRCQNRSVSAIAFLGMVIVAACGERAPFDAGRDAASESVPTDSGGTTPLSTDMPTVAETDSETGTGVPLDTDTGTTSGTATDTGTTSGTATDTGTTVDTASATGGTADTASATGGTADTASATGDSGDTSTDTGTGSAGEGDPDGGRDGEDDAGAGDGGARDGGDADTLRMFDLAVADNPNSVLSCFVTWRTSRPASSAVDVGVSGFEFRLKGGDGLTHHRVLVFGMRAETEYRLSALSEADGEQVHLETRYATGILPDIVPTATLGADDFGASRTGWTLTNISDRAVEPRPPCVVVMYDEQGRPVWYFINGDLPDDRGDIDVRYLEGGTVLVGPTGNTPAREVDLAGNVLWEGPAQDPLSRTTMNHHFEKLPSGNYLTIRDQRQDGILGNSVEALTPDRDVVWQWSIFDHAVPDEDTGSDWCHGNSVTMAPAGDAFYLSCRNMSAVLKISLTGARDILWRFGAGGDFAPDPLAVEPWFLNQHDPELQENGNFLVYDNGGLYADTLERSRVVEYTVDEATMTSAVVWEFPGDFSGVDPWYTTEWYTPIWGDADRLENGNVLVTAGTRDVGAESRIFEVTPDGAVVWDIRIPAHDGRARGIYRAQRISPPPLIETYK